MENINYFVDFFLHLDTHLGAVTNEYGLLTYLLLFAIVFCETGLVVTPFLPGDSLIFATGALVAAGSLDLSTVFIILCFAAIIGDSVNYQVGHLLRDKISGDENIRLIKKEHLTRTQTFYERHGVKTIIIARFVPIIRTFAPFVAGIGKMHYPRFLSYNVIGGVLWVSLFLFGGYFFGNLPFVKDNFSFVILGIIFVSLLPGIFTYLQSRRDANRA
ncbi:MAG: DedA family protein [Methanococcaceae archaeon]